MKEEIINIRNQALARIEEVENASELIEIRSAYLGKRGLLTEKIRGMGSIAENEKVEIGILINETKKTIEKFLGRKGGEIAVPKEKVDETIPGIEPGNPPGHIHLISQTIEEIARIFERIGFVRRRYPEIDWDWYAFQGLGFGDNHPARDEWETFFVDGKEHPKMGQMLLTPHTSNGQLREMELMNSTPPIRMINIGKTYRRQSDASHVPMFHQFEGLVIDRGINITNLRGTLDYFASAFFGNGRKTRIRPYNFPFTEPSFEVDVNCGNCDGKGCKVCKEGWLEIGGSGMVHPTVLRNGGIDPKEFRGFAFGWGVERVAMVRAGLSDIRQIYSNDLRFLRQF